MCEDGNRFVKLSICAMKYLHHGLWMWLSENPDQNKDDWPDWGMFYNKAETPEDDVYDDVYDNVYDEEKEIFEDELDEISMCFGCAAAEKDLGRNEPEDCERCLLKWPTEKPCYQGIYDEWKYADSTDEAVELAKQIAALPLNPYWKEKYDEEMSDLKKVVLDDIEYSVLDETKTHYICAPLNSSEGYSWISKELVDVSA